VPDLSVVLVMTSELVTNVVRHAGGEATVTVRRGPPVRIEVHDRMAPTDALRERVRRAPMPDVTATGGRGLAIVQALATQAGIDDHPGGGKVIWFEV
jgi:anti-sigma regulatory factor (Ser/Thr protein kinase)